MLAYAFNGLSTREMQILALVVDGQTNNEIAQKLHLSSRTVRNYISDILGKLNLTSRVQAAAYAARNRIEDYVWLLTEPDSQNQSDVYFYPVGP